MLPEDTSGPILANAVNLMNDIILAARKTNSQITVCNVPAC
jgi:hypothetical protein